VHISFSLPGGKTPPVEAVAKVVWTNQDECRSKPNFAPGNGLKFTGLEQKSEQALQEFIKLPREAGELLH